MNCTACPRSCNIARAYDCSISSNYGACGSPLLPTVARAGLHFWEEPIISGKNGSGTVFFSGCNLHCVYCQNHDISNAKIGKQITVERLQQIYHELINQGAHNINLVTPSHYIQSINQSLATPLPVPVVYNSNGYDSVESLQTLTDKIQIYLPDLKYANNAVAYNYSSVNNYFETACEAIKEMYRQVGPYNINDNGLLTRGVIIRHLVLPGHVENSLSVIDWVAKNFRPGEVLFSLMHQFIPCGLVSETSYPELNRKLTAHEYKLVEDVLFASSIEDGFVQQESSASREFIPSFDGTGV